MLFDGAGVGDGHFLVQILGQADERGLYRGPVFDRFAPSQPGPVGVGNVGQIVYPRLIVGRGGVELGPVGIARCGAG